MTSVIATFPFGQPARLQPPEARRAELFILGAYPSALHIRWVPPAGKAIRALAVDVEPHAFWSGADELERVEAWKRDVGWRAEYGAAEPAGRLNGSSGVWVDEQILAPLGVAREDAWITDCLHYYCASTAGARRIADTYTAFAESHGLPKAVLPAHPSEAAIVKAADAELDRLREELRVAAPAVVVTLGNAALRVLGKLVEGLPKKLGVTAYGAAVMAEFEGRKLEVLPLAHPAAPKPYQEAHGEWVLRVVEGNDAAATGESGPPETKKKRTEIPPTRADEVIAEADRTCCVCRRRQNLQIHHLNENPADHRFDNLVGLCPNCHADVHGSAAYTRKFTSSHVRRFRDEWYERVRERKAKGMPRLELSESVDFDTVVEAVAVVRIREIGRRTSDVDLDALATFSTGFGSRVALEALAVLDGVLLHGRDDRALAQDACRILRDFLPILSLVGRRHHPFTAEELVVLNSARWIGRTVGYHAARRSHDLVVLDAGGRVLWEILRVGILNEEDELRGPAAGTFAELERWCEETGFEDGRRWLRFLREDASQNEEFQGEYPADLSAKVRELRAEA